MNAHRVEVFHVADYDAVIILITHYLVFIFSPAQYAFFYQDLLDTRITQTQSNYFLQLLLIFSNAAAGATHQHLFGAVVA